MSDTHHFEPDPVDQLLSGPPTSDPAAHFVDGIKQAASPDQPVRIDAALADLFAPPTPAPRRTWRPAMLLRPAATLGAAFVAVLMLGAGAVALVGPEIVDTITGADRPTADGVDLGDGPDAISVDREAGDTDYTEVRVMDESEREDVEVDVDPVERSEKPDPNAVNEEAVAAWVACTEAGFDMWLDTFGTEEGVPEGLFADCPTSDEGSLGVAGHQYKDAMQAWFQCVSEYAHTSEDVELDVVGACEAFPVFADFGIDVPDADDAKVRDRVEEVNQRSDELAGERNRAGEGRNHGGNDVRNDSSDEGRSPVGDRTGEG